MAATSQAGLPENAWRWGHLAFWIVLWANLLNHLRVDWSINPQYSYGWGVPLLALYLAFQRWEDRPEQQRSNIRPTMIATAACLLLLLPLRLLREANPDWRPVSWIFGLTVVAATWLGLYYQGGKRFWAHFAAPVAFVLLAIPWPTPIEQLAIQGLMQNVAAITVETLNWIGIPAEQSGNLIRLPTGVVGVDEACSGVRSLQATLMAAIFFGELQRFALIRRAALLGLGILTALVLNLVRTFILTYISARFGPDILERWHDSAGYVILFLAFVCLLLLTRWLQRWERRRDEPVPLASFSWRDWPHPVTAAALCWLISITVINEWWYRSHEANLLSREPWTFDWSPFTSRATQEPIPESVILLMRYHEGEAVKISMPTGSEWLIYYFRWRPGRSSTLLARSHSPEICLPATGIRQTGERRFRTLTIESLELPFRTYTFDYRNRPLHVFFCLAEDRMTADSARLEAAGLDRWSRFQSVFQGKRHLGQAILEVVIMGPATREQAWQEVEHYLPGMIQRQRETSTHPPDNPPGASAQRQPGPPPSRHP